MIRRIIAASAVALLGVLLIGVPPAHAANTTVPQPIKLWDVTFSENDCSGKVLVTLKNKIEKVDAGLVFLVNTVPHTVPPESTEVVVITYPDSTLITVDLSGAYDPSPDVEAKSIIDRTIHWDHKWERPDGCWTTTSTSYCDNGFTVTVQNTAPDPEPFKVAVGDTDEVSVPVAGLATWSKNYPKGTTVTVVTDEDTFHTYQWAGKDCVTPAPTPVPSPEGPPPAAGLPETGASLTVPIVGGVIFLVGAVGLAVWAVRVRRREGLNGV